MRVKGGFDFDGLTAIGMFMFQPMGIFLVIAGICVCLSIALVVLRLEGLKYAKTVGRVYDASCENSDDGTVVCDVAFDFEVNGRSYSNRVRAGVSFVEGDIVNLKYNPADPNDADIILIDWSRLAWMLIFLCGCWMLAHIAYLTATDSN